MQISHKQTGAWKSILGQNSTAQPMTPISACHYSVEKRRMK